VVVPLKVRAHVLVSGRVQGVFFRSETSLRAKRLDVVGWVRNLADGRLEAVFEGEEMNVKQLIDFCRKGPPGAKVANVNVVWETYTGEFRSFEVENGLGF
jgi:acylphosphatase